MARAAMPKAKKKVRSTRTPKFLDEKYTGSEPEWDNSERWTAEKYYRERSRVGYYYNYYYTSKDGKPWLLDWMKKNGYKNDEMKWVRSVPDAYISIIVCAYCKSLMRGMPSHHSGLKEYLKRLPGIDNDAIPDAILFVKKKIAEYIELGKTIKQEKEEVETVKKKVAAYRPSIQQLTKEKAAEMAEEIETFVDRFDKSKSSLKEFNPLSVLRAKEAKPLHASAIMEMYRGAYEEINDLLNPPKRMTEEKKKDYEDLKEGYRHLKKAEQLATLQMYQMILEACEMVVQEGKVNRKPRKKKPVSKEKMVAKFKYCEKHDDTKLVSVKPIDLIGAVAAMVYNTKTRKLGIYIAQDGAGFNIKGTSIIGFDEVKSVQKTLRKPLEQLSEFKKIAKRSLMPKFDEIKSVVTKMNGRFSEQIVIIKVF